MARSTGRAGQRAALLTERARQSADPAARRYPVAGAGIRAVRAAIRAYRQDQVITHDQAGWLLVALHDLWVRDDALCRMDAANRQAHLKLWADLTRLASPGHVAASATLLAYVAWQSDDGLLANVALERALDDDPFYPMARILCRLLDHGTSPAKAELPMTPRQVAAYYRARARGTGRPTLAASQRAGDGHLSA